MSRSQILMILASLALSITACGSGQQQPAESPGTADGASADTENGSRAAAPDAGEDVCADQQPTGDPPVCPASCVWDESKHRCTQLRGVIVDQRPRPRPSPIPDMRPMPAPSPRPNTRPVPQPEPPVNGVIVDQYPSPSPLPDRLPQPTPQPMPQPMPRPMPQPLQ
ncbi:hypothetical protein WMF04_07180 [Sorangium sp. So ce260]|uniref:hypothetical protein n=1 Tax=Sorangium sp. So ce260 TaxID=3133291 RepID=UPI003F646414